MTYKERKRQIAITMAKTLYTEYDRYPESYKELLIVAYEREAEIAISFGRYCYDKGFLQASANGKSIPEDLGLWLGLNPK